MKLLKCNILHQFLFLGPIIFFNTLFSMFAPQHVTSCETHTKHPVKLWCLYFNCVYGLSSQLDF